MKKSICLALVVLGVAVSAAQPQCWPKGTSPREVGAKLTDLFLSASPYDYKPAGYASRSYTYPDGKVRYPIVCEWVAALEFAEETGDKERIKKLCAPFEAYHGGFMKDKLPTLRHVDFSVFGALPLAIYRTAGDDRALAIGLRYADKQWEPPREDDQPHPHLYPLEKRRELFAKGYSPETRLWVDDMWMITILQVNAYLATGKKVYIERAAKEMAYYLDELQNPDGLFFHAPDVPFVWGRGDGWFAAGMARLLRHLPSEIACRERILSGYRLMMGALLKAQREDGLWGQLVGDHGSWAETSGSGMFAYALAVGVNEGWIDAKVSAPAVRKAYLALVARLDAYGNINDVCAGTSKLNDRAYYLNRPRGIGDPHGQTALLWTATELSRKTKTAW
jgi:rhamnogalacturonyl hydrolase YesR